MRKWWWWWLPGLHKKWRLEKRRQETLADIRVERSLIEAMAQRPRPKEDTLEPSFLAERLERLSDIENSAGQATNIDDLDDLVRFAEQQGQLRAYICPVGEIEREGILVVDLIREWGVPQTVIQKLSQLHGETLRKAETNPQDARAALRSLFQERDSWAEYTDDYEDVMKRYTWLLFPAAIILPFLAVIFFSCAFYLSPLLVLGLLCAGAAGSCVSVLAKMPLLDVALSAELEAYGRRILGRIAVGVGASLIGCALPWMGRPSCLAPKSNFHGCPKHLSSSPCHPCRRHKNSNYSRRPNALRLQRACPDIL
jgi:hypothetical protein